MDKNATLTRREKLGKISIFGLLLALEIILFVTPLGFIPIGPLNLTTLHIPVIVSSILLGHKYGALMGFLFGLFSFMRNTFSPGLTSFVFSPFVSFGAVSGNFWSLVICFVPRILLGAMPAWIQSGLNKLNKNEAANAGISAAIATFMHTILVLSGIYIFFGEAYAEAIGIAVNTILAVLGTTVAVNGLSETALAFVVVYALMKIYLNRGKDSLSNE